MRCSAALSSRSSATLPVNEATPKSQLSRYLPQREADTGQRFVGIATDGAEFHVYMVRDGRLDELGQFRPKVSEPRGLLGWLESVVALHDEIPPDVVAIQRELGRHSIAYHEPSERSRRLWDDLKDDPEANLKRDLVEPFATCRLRRRC